MSLDELQQTWQSQSSRVLVPSDALLAQVRSNQRSFKATIFWRDFLEVIVALSLIPFFAYAAYKQGWPWLSFCVSSLWIAGFLLIDRWLRRSRRPAPDESLIRCVESSLEELEHQIWLLRNVAWWYLLPGTLAAIVSFGFVSAGLPDDPAAGRAIFLAIGLGAFAVVDVAVYRLNQTCVRKELEPRRRELVATRDSLLTSSSEAPLAAET